ncbi:MAG: hypothetical protein WCJ59_02980 [bacterium]
MYSTYKIDSILDKLDTAETSNKKVLMTELCKACIEAENNKELYIEQAAYLICGACAKHINLIKPEFEDVINIACDLELPPEHRERPLDDWDKLKELIKGVR